MTDREIADLAHFIANCLAINPKSVEMIQCIDHDNDKPYWAAIISERVTSWLPETLPIPVDLAGDADPETHLSYTDTIIMEDAGILAA